MDLGLGVALLLSALCHPRPWLAGSLFRCWHRPSPCLPPERSLTQSLSPLTSLLVFQSLSSVTEAMPFILREKQGIVNAFRSG